MKLIEHPLRLDANLVLEKEIDIETIINLYQKRLRYDVSSYFQDLPNLKVYRCQETGYRFYYPFNVAGDGQFYEFLQQFPWYYLSWKWEHELSCDYLQKGDKLLEVGSGEGEFIKRIHEQKQVIATGLELNEKAVNEFQNKEGLKLIGQYVQDHVDEYREYYDVVCSYQVLEHISDIDTFIAAQLNCLKPNGLFIISVPNNKSLLMKDNWEDHLNMPPHHMGLWEDASLKKLTKLYPIDLVDIHKEPLQEQHYSWYIDQWINHKFGRFSSKVFGKLNQIFKIYSLAKSKLRKESSNIEGHSILAVYKKRS